MFIFWAVLSYGYADEVKPRYISLAPSTTEILFALGLDEEIVAVSLFCDYPEKAKTKEKAGDFSQPNIEKILSLKPDYIFCTGLEQAQAILALKRLGLKVYVQDPKNLNELYATIKEIGNITLKNHQAEALIKDMQNRVDGISSKVKAIPVDKRKKIFLEIWHDPLTTAGKGSFINDLIVLAGGVNIATDTKRPFSIFSAEEVIQRNPDCIVLAYMDGSKPGQLMAKRFGWENINAVKNNRVFNDIVPELLLRPGPRVVEGIRELYKRLYEY